VVVDAHVESELRELHAQDKQQFRQEYGVFSAQGGSASGRDDPLDDLIYASYELLGLISFFTTGEEETRAWTIKKGTTAPLAGAAIHSDFRDKFIRAEVVDWKVLLEDGSWARAREGGHIRTEGKEYVVQDGDVIVFLHG
jgi:ribosome-binding ATPase YchF (GTP1/OBG family)